MRPVLTLLCCALARSAFAQLPAPDAGDLWISFDEIGNKLCTVAAPYPAAHQFYVVTRDPPGGLTAYALHVSVDPSLIVFQASDATGACCSDILNGPWDWVVGIGYCLPTEGNTALVFYQYWMLDEDPRERFVCLGPLDPPGIDPPAPNYLSCADDILPFTTHPQGGVAMPDGCGLVYAGSAPPTFDVDSCSFETVPVAADSWGSIKSRFH